MHHSTTPLRIAAAPAADAWLDGAPASVSSAAIHVDLVAYRKMICPVCKKRGGKATPQHNATGVYRVLFSCHTCHYREAC